MKPDQKTLQDILRTHEKYRHSYHWHADNGNLAARARNEFDDEYVWVVNGDRIDVRQYMHQSRKNTYYKLRVSLNGEKKDVRLIKKLLKEVAA